MNKVLLDSNILIDFFKKKPDSKVVKTLEEQKSLGMMFCICDIVLAEFRAGLTPIQYQKVKSYLDYLYYFETSPKIALGSGELYWQLFKKGKAIPLSDCFVIAIARHHQATLLTRDFNHFSNLILLVKIIFI